MSSRGRSQIRRTHRSGRVELGRQRGDVGFATGQIPGRGFRRRSYGLLASATEVYCGTEALPRGALTVSTPPRCPLMPSAPAGLFYRSPENVWSMIRAIEKHIWCPQFSCWSISAGTTIQFSLSSHDPCESEVKLGDLEGYKRTVRRIPLLCEYEHFIEGIKKLRAPNDVSRQLVHHLH